MARKGLSKRLRFEVFKRDQFKCQYCGASAPDVVLAVDHVKPCADGGDSSLLNLITACEPCNSGKSDVPLADSTAVKKQLTQIRNLAERREQMAMLVAWRDGLQNLEEEKVVILVDRVNARLKTVDPNGRLNEHGIARVRVWLKKFGLDCTLHGISDAPHEDNLEGLIDRMEQFSAARAKVQREPELRDFWRIRARFRFRGFRYGPEWAPVDEMRRAFKAGRTIEELDAAAAEANSYDEFCGFIRSES